MSSSHLTFEPLELPIQEQTDGRHGAVLRFLGVVRGLECGKEILGIRYSAYEPMAEQQLVKIIVEARTTIGPAAAEIPVYLVHRLGFVPVGEPSVIIEISTVHSLTALQLCQEILRKLKAEVPIWKEFVE